MAIRWSDITIFHDGKPWRAGAARKWVHENVGGLVTDNEPKSSLVNVKIGGANLTGVEALEAMRTVVENHGGRMMAAQLSLRRPQAAAVRRESENVIRPVLSYAVELVLGDVDAIFDPIGGGEPSAETGVRQRLQALGYLYTPLDHARIAAHASLCWAYYKKVHALEDDGEAKAWLQAEIKGNLLAASFPGSGQVLAASALPAPADGDVPEEVAAIRFPGGYATTEHSVSRLNVGDHEFNNHVKTPARPVDVARIGDPRQKVEDTVFAANDRLGKLPLLAKVTVTDVDNNVTDAVNVPVHFSLVGPSELPAASPFRAPDPPDEVMNYDLVGVLWDTEDYPGSDAVLRLQPLEWKGVYRLTKKAFEQDEANAATLAKQWIDAWAIQIPLPWSWVDAWWGNEAETPTPVTSLELEKLRTEVPSILMAVHSNSKLPKSIGGAQGEIKAVIRLARAALDRYPNLDDRKQACALALEWIDKWVGATWDRVQGWWGKQDETPYPALRRGMVNNANTVVDKILAARLDAKTRPKTLAGGQKTYLKALFQRLEQAATDQGDPQKKNAPADPYGGKAGHADGIKAVLETPDTRRTGFHTPRAGQSPDSGTLELAAASDRPYAVKCNTNAQGYAGVIFTPSRCGGDTYRLRATIDPVWLQQNAAGGAHSPTSETGTMVVWRNIRIGRYIKMETPPAKDYSKALTTTLNAALVNKIGQGAFPDMRLDDPTATAAVLPALPAEAEYKPTSLADAMKSSSSEWRRMYRPVKFTPATFAEQLRWAYCELIGDATEVTPVDENMRKDVAAVARAAMKAAGKIAEAVDWKWLIFADPTSPFFINLRGFEEYNEFGGMLGFPKLSKDEHGEKLGEAKDWAWEAIAEKLSGGGVLPGLTLIQFPRGDTWDWKALDIKGNVTSGYGTAARTAYLSHTEGVYRGYFAYPCTANAVHELGHVLGLAHQPPAPSHLVPAHQYAGEEPFAPFQRPDVQAKQHVVCVMSYSGCYGHFCALCLLALRGWYQTHQNTL
jgi:hypothetical protein